MKKASRLRNKLPIVDIADGVRERMEGHEWSRVGDLAIKNNVSTSTILNWIKSGKLEGCNMCGMIHGREPLKSQGGQNDQNQSAEEPKSSGN